MRRLLLLACLVAGVGFASPAQAQFFRNQGVSFSAGWLGLGTTWDGLTSQKLWNIHDQGALGAGYFTAIGYNLWLDAAASIGASTTRITEADFEPIFSFNLSTGLRYNFLEERLRPFVSGHIHYLQIIPVTANPPIPTNAFLGNAPFWVGGRAGGGVEYIFADEMSVLLELNVGGFVGANTPPPNGPQTFVLPAATGRLGYQIYF
jgi:hypothetical protein